MSRGAALVLTMLAASMPAQAHDVVAHPAGFVCAVPPGWTAVRDGDAILLTDPSHEGLRVVLQPPRVVTSFERAADLIDAEVARSGLRVTSVEHRGRASRQNGVDVVALRAVAEVRRTLDVSESVDVLAFVFHDDGRLLLGMGLVPRKHSGEYLVALRTLRSVRARQ